MRLITLHQKCSSSGLAVLLEQCLPVHTGVLLDTAPKDTMPAPQHQKITASAGLNFTVLHTAHCDTHLGAGVHGEAQLGLLAVVHRQALQQQGAQAGAGTTTHSVEHQEALQASAVVGQLADAVQGQVNNLLANCSRLVGKRSTASSREQWTSAWGRKRPQNSTKHPCDDKDRIAVVGALLHVIKLSCDPSTF